MKDAQNEILSNFAFMGNVDLAHLLGARGNYPKLAVPPPVTPSLIKLAFTS